MFKPDVMLPAQFASLQRKPLPSEKRLLLAMLEDAVHCFQTYALASKPHERQLCRDAEEWINSTDSEWVFSFENICEVLGLHPAYLRNALKQWKAEQILLHDLQQQTRRGRVARGGIQRDIALISLRRV